MKKIMFFTAISAVVSLASCQKEALNEAAGTESPVFTATISTGTKTTVNATDGKVAWESTDKITITDASAASAIYKIKSIDGNTGKATFEVESGTLGQGPYTATYGTAPATSQTYSATPGKLHMTASSETTSLTFSVQCGLMEINLTKAGESVKSIAVTGTPTGESETTYTLTCTDAQSIAEKTAFYISVAAGSYNKIVITDSEDKVCTLTAASGLTLENNHIKPITFDANKLNFLPVGALKGEFSVSATKNVYFSKGNLWYGKVGDAQTATLHFEDAQWKSTPASDGSKDANHVSHFTWSDNVTAAVGNSNSGSYLFCDEDNKQSVDGSDKIYYALSTAEWQYLFDTRTVNGGTKEGKSYQRATINSDATSVYGMILYPDNYTSQTGAASYSSTEWTTMEENGCVFLPAAGDRFESDVCNVGGDGRYWSSTAYGSDAFFVGFDSGVAPGDNGSRFRGFSVRLITESK